VALNIKNAEVERLAGEVAHLAQETKTEAIRRALEQRLARLSAEGGRKRSKEHIIEYLRKEVWPNIPKEVLGKRISKREREKILGYGPHGV
jgi:antitoxin VapB